MEEKKNKTWGGARKGAGRKPKGENMVTFSFTLEKALLDKTSEEAVARGVSRSEIISEALKAYLDGLIRKAYKAEQRER